VGLVRTRPSRRTLGAGLLGAIALASGVALTATSGWLIVRASERPVILTLLTAIVAVRTFGMARPVFRYWERLRSHDAALDDLGRARTDVYAALVPLAPARLARHGRAAMLAGVVDDLTDRVEAQVRVTVPLVAVGLTGLATVVLCALAEPAAGLAVAALLLVASAVTALAWRVETHGQDDLTLARAEVLRVSELVASQALELQAIGAQDRSLAWVREAHLKLARCTKRQSRGRALAAGAIPVATALATVACAAVAATSDRSDPVTALLVLAPFALAEVFTPLPDVARAAARAQAAGRRLDHLLDLQPAVAAEGTADLPPAEGGPDSTAPHLRLHGAAASWDGSSTDLAPTDLDLAPGEVLAVSGPSGGGKSTMLAVLARHLDPSAGRYTVDGVDALSLDLEQVRSLFAIVDDEPHVFASTLRENLRLARPDAADEAIVDALAAAGLRPWLDGLPRGLDTDLGTGATGVSGGERARLSVARALLSGRPVILLDEPVAHLDHPTAVAVLHDLLAARQGRSVVVVSHRPEGLTGAGGIMELAGRTPASGNGPQGTTPGTTAR
jgi:ATP-binding cassette, subfamily C, bacterial CydC